MHTFDLDRLGAGLTVAGARAELERAVSTGAAVVTAPPGTGKTTFVPPLVANALGGRILVTQPRRVAVRAAARRIADLDGTRLGGPSGFTVRGEKAVSAETRIETVTPGVLLRRLLNDPALEGISAVILDEVHERSVDSDLLLGMLGEVRALREDLVLVAMSATITSGPLADLLGAAVVDVPSALHPLEIAYAPSSTPRLGVRGVEHDFLDHVADVAVSEQRATGHDALVFVPSARDVDVVVRR
ncbi:MAG: DEAD/DEAH box helicase, partial [Microbacterium gubbeenense]